MNQGTKAVLLSIVAVLGGLLFNFLIFDATLLTIHLFRWHIIVTILCMALWVYILIFAAKNNLRKILLYYSMFWMLVFFTAILHLFLYQLEPHYPIHWAVTFLVIPFTILLFGQFMGMAYWFWGSLSIFLTIILVFSLGMSIASMVLGRFSCKDK